MDDSEYYERAKEKVEEKKNFHNHLRSYIIVNLIMLFFYLFQIMLGFFEEFQLSCKYNLIRQVFSKTGKWV